MQIRDVNQADHAVGSDGAFDALQAVTLAAASLIELENYSVTLHFKLLAVSLVIRNSEQGAGGRRNAFALRSTSRLLSRASSVVPSGTACHPAGSPLLRLGEPSSRKLHSQLGSEQEAPKDSAIQGQRIKARGN